MHKILITTSSFGVDTSPSLRELVAKNIAYIANPYGRRLSDEEATALIKEHQPIGMIAGVETLGRAQLEACPTIKVVSRCGTGMDNVDLAAAKELGITVYNTPDAPSPSVAELALGIMLSCLRQIPQADRLIRDGKWTAQKGSLLSGKTVGIIGFGRIGQKLATLLSGFGVTLLAYDPHVATPAHPHAHFTSLEQLVLQCDILSLHLPYNSETHHLFNRARIAAMKPDAILINVARGGLIDEVALYNALSEGHLSAAGLDVFEQEPYSGPLSTLPNVVLTAHMGSAAKETRQIMEEEAAANLLKGLISAGMLHD